MNRRQRDPTAFGRVVRPRLDPERRLLWRFDSDHIRGGPANDVPIIIRARPIDVPGVALDDYVLELAIVFQAAMEILVNRYAHRVHRRTLPRNQIRTLPIFFFPTDVFFFNTRLLEENN
jgi:hypothetical protein